MAPWDVFALVVGNESSWDLRASPAVAGRDDGYRPNICFVKTRNINSYIILDQAHNCFKHPMDVLLDARLDGLQQTLLVQYQIYICFCQKQQL